MDKKTFIKEIQSKIDGCSQGDIAVVLDTVAEVIIETVKAGDSVTLPGIGKFTTTEVGEKTGVIQFGERKGEKYTTPAHRKPVFKASKNFKEIVK